MARSLELESFSIQFSPFRLLLIAFKTTILFGGSGSMAQENLKSS
jgi:hypothetical protein